MPEYYARFGPTLGLVAASHHRHPIHVYDFRGGITSIGEALRAEGEEDSGPALWRLPIRGRELAGRYCLAGGRFLSVEGMNPRLKIRRDAPKDGGPLAGVSRGLRRGAACRRAKDVPTGLRVPVRIAPGDHTMRTPGQTVGSCLSPAPIDRSGCWEPGTMSLPSAWPSASGKHWRAARFGDCASVTLGCLGDGPWLTADSEGLSAYQLDGLARAVDHPPARPT
jgi:hypothetical protein